MLLNHLMTSVNSCPTKHLFKRRAINERAQMHPIIILQIFLFWFTTINIITHTFFKEVKFFTFEFYREGVEIPSSGSYEPDCSQHLLGLLQQCKQKITSLYNNNSLNFIFFLIFSFILRLQLIDFFGANLLIFCLFTNNFFTFLWLVCVRLSRRPNIQNVLVFRTHNNATIYCPHQTPFVVFVRIF